MIRQTFVLHAISSGNYHLSLPLIATERKNQFSLLNDLRLLATLIRCGKAKSIHVSARETIVVIAFGKSRIGFIWKLMPSGKLLLRDIQNLDEVKEAKCSAKVLPFSTYLKGVAA